MKYLYIIKPVKDNFLETMTEEESAIMSEHADYLDSLLKKGKLFLAGPALNGKLGIGIFEVEDEKEAKEIVYGDPAVAKKIVNVEYYPFKISFMKS